MDRKVCPTTTSSETKISRTIYFYHLFLSTGTITMHIFPALLVPLLFTSSLLKWCPYYSHLPFSTGTTTIHIFPALMVPLLNYNMSNQQLPTTDQQRDLEIIITKDLHWQKQKSCKTDNRVLGFIARNFRCKNK